MRIIFMGTPEFAVPTLQRLIESRHNVALVVTQPDKPVGRGRKIQPPPVKQLALQHGIPIEQPEKLRKTSFHETLATYEPDVIVVAAYGKILPPDVLAVPRLGCLNVHASLLPKYRGAAPINWAIINGDRKTGVTIMHMDEGMDTGGIVLQREINILDDDDALSVSNMLSVLGADAMIEVLEEVERDNRIVSQSQDDGLATPAPMLKKSDGDLDWTMTSEQIICRMHGLRPWPGCFSKLGAKTIRLIDADRLTGIEFAAFQSPKHKPGQVVETVRGRGPIVCTGDGYIVLVRAKPEGRSEMTGTDLINGGYIVPPMQFERVGFGNSD